MQAGYMGSPGEIACLRVCTVMGRGLLPPDSRHWITSPKASTTCCGSGPISYTFVIFVLDFRLCIGNLMLKCHYN